MLDARMDRMRRMLQEEQQNQLETLIQTSGSLSLPPQNHDSTVSLAEERTVEIHDKVSNEGSDHTTYYPPVFV